MNLEDIYIYRIIHIDNLDYILKQNELIHYQHSNADPNYINIGQKELITKRKSHKVTTQVTNEAYCPSCEYIPFYFWYYSVMLYNIQNGYDTDKIKANEIIYLVYQLKGIINDIDFLFTDGHGFKGMTKWYDDISQVNHIDWNTIKSTNWANTEDDSDRKRRKQAEFWIKEKVSLNKITGIAVFDTTTQKHVVELCQKNKKNINVKVHTHWYY